MIADCTCGDAYVASAQQHRQGCKAWSPLRVLGPSAAEKWQAARARAQSSSEQQFRARVGRWLELRPALCPGCRRGSWARYPDWRCAEHTVWLDGSALERRQRDNDAAGYLATWRAFFAATK